MMAGCLGRSRLGSEYGGNTPRGADTAGVAVDPESVETSTLRDHGSLGADGGDG